MYYFCPVRIAITALKKHTFAVCCLNVRGVVCRAEPEPEPAAPPVRCVNLNQPGGRVLPTTSFSWAPMPPGHTPRIPDLPGQLVRPDYVGRLQATVAQLCQLNSTKYVRHTPPVIRGAALIVCTLALHRFPGSQPVSFSNRDLSRLENEE